MTHIPDSFAFRVSAAAGDGPGLVYSGDCGNADDLLPLIRPGDTLLSEAAWGAGRPDVPIHLTATQAAGAAARGGAKNLILTHILDDRRESEARAAAERTFDGDVSVPARASRWTSVSSPRRHDLRYLFSVASGLTVGATPSATLR